jgi:predicted aspartyl protease
MLTESTVASLHLPVGRLQRVYLEGFGGYRIDHYAEAHDVNLGGLQASIKQFLIMPDEIVSRGINGTLAPDILRAYDDDFDFANATLNLVSPDHCPGEVVYWTKDAYSEIGFQLDGTGHVMLQVQMDGAKFRAHIDTGSSRSIMGLDEARNLFGFDEKSPDLKSVQEQGLARAYHYPFRNLAFGGVAIANPDILLVPESDSRMTGMLIGVDVLRQLHLFIAYNERKMYVTPVGAH